MGVQASLDDILRTGRQLDTRGLRCAGWRSSGRDFRHGGVLTYDGHMLFLLHAKDDHTRAILSSLLSLKSLPNVQVSAFWGVEGLLASHHQV
jgi:hypothetical protein